MSKSPVSDSMRVVLSDILKIYIVILTFVCPLWILLKKERLPELDSYVFHLVIPRNIQKQGCDGLDKVRSREGACIKCAEF